MPKELYETPLVGRKLCPGDEEDEFELYEQSVNGVQGDEVEGNEEPPEPEGEERLEPRLYAGKYRTPEEMEDGYKHAQSELTRKSQELAELQKQATGKPDKDPVEAFNEQFYDNPAAAIQHVAGNMAQQAITVYEAASDNIQFEMDKRSDDPMFASIKADFRREMRKLDKSVLANDTQAAEAADFIYDKCLGQKIREASKKDPAERVSALKKLGISAPEPTPADGGEDMATAAQRRMLAQMGHKDKKTQDEIIARAAKEEDSF